MVERYLDQKVAVYSKMTDQAESNNVKDIVTLSENDIRLAEEVIKVCKPLKTVHSISFHGPAYENNDPEINDGI